MKKCFYKVVEFVILMMFVPIVVNANIVCNDGTTSKSCMDCHKGCCSSHGGCSNSTFSSSSTNVETNTNNSSSSENTNGSNNTNNNVIETPAIVEPPKSSDATLKEITIDDKKIDISNDMSYATTNETVSINAIANDDKAKVDYDKNPDLVIGDNLLSIKVTAENGKVKEYKLNITREKILSNNTNIKIKVNDEEVTFNEYKSEPIYLSYNEYKINIQYELEDKNAKVEIIGNENLKEGINEVIVKVIAENGENQNYTLVVEKYNKTDEMTVNIIASLFIIVPFVGIGLLVFYLTRKKKTK